MNNDLHELFQKHNQRQFEDLLAQFNIVSEWVDKFYPELDFHVEFNDDQVAGLLRIKIRLFTDKTMDPKKDANKIGHDQMLRKSELRINKTMWDDPVFMTKYIKEIVPNLQKEINKEVNDWYRKRQALVQESKGRV